MIPFSFINEETTLFMYKVIQIINHGLPFTLKTILVLNDCDEETLAYIRILVDLHRILPGLKIDQLAVLATYLTLIHKYSSVVRELRNRELNEHEYHEYQVALEKTTHYLGLLVENLDKSTLNNILDVLHQLEEIHIDEETVESLRRIIGFGVVSEVLFVSRFSGRCTKTFIEVLIDVWDSLGESERGTELYIVVPKELLFLIKEKIPGDRVIDV